MNPDKAVGLPHVRGGVSDKMIVDWGDGTSSPRAWGCFYLKEDMTLRIVVFPTCVGVFPEDEARELTDAGLPHVRGGVSFVLRLGDDKVLSSPRAWGCFRRDPHG